MVKVMLMNATTKIGLAILVVAVLFVNPIGACAENMAVASPPAHPCCPKDQAPAPEECAKPGCVCINARPAAFVVPANDDQGPVLAVAEEDFVLLSQPTTFGTLAIERICFVRDHRFITLCQLLI